MVHEILERNKNKIPSWLTKPKSLAITGLVVLVILTAGFFLFNSRSSDSTEDKPTVKIGKSYEIIARTSEGQRTTGRFNLTVTSTQFADSILVQGKRATPVKGKTFLVINMEIENPFKVSLYAFPVDLFRFVREDGQKFAPSVHQGAVRIRPESTKKSNAAFIVLPNEKKFKIEVGDINSPKETLEITF